MMEAGSLSQLLKTEDKQHKKIKIKNETARRLLFFDSIKQNEIIHILNLGF